jgi:hypothetical protein
MGLDMYLTGEALFTPEHPNRRLKPYAKEGETYRLGYWRKHPNLHGFIVQTFADGVDECQEIDLTAEAIRSIIDAVKNRELPQTTGFFFGTSDDTDEQIAHDIQIFEEALKWLETEESEVWRSVSYCASW